MRIHIGNDHRGYALKQRARAWLEEHGHEVVDHGAGSTESCDYPDYAFAVARAVVAHPGDLGVVICSNGIGVSMAANKVPGARAALAVTPAMASQSRRHNDANVLALGAENVSLEENLRILAAWLAASFEGGRHARRVGKMVQGEGCPAVRRSGPADQGGEMKTDPGCVFCKIVAGQIPAEKVHEDEHVLAFKDLHPAAPFHALLIPKEHIPTLNHLEEEHDLLMGRLLRAAGRVAATHGLGAGYRLVGNCERAAGQEVFHIHFHMLGGRALGWPPG